MKHKAIYITVAVFLVITLVTGGYAATQPEEVSRIKSALSDIVSGVFNGTDEDEYIRQIRELAERYQGVEEQNRILKKELDEAQKELDRFYEKYEENAELVKEYRNKINELEKEQQSLKEEIQRLEQENKKLREQARKPEPAPSPGPTGKTAYLTFDDGPSHNTEKVLDILKDYGIKATFFVCGNDTPFGHRMYQRMVNEGHVIGNHTYTHNYETIYESPKAFMKDFYRLEELLDRVVGINPDIMRFPGGSRSASALNVAGYDVIHYIIKILENEGYVYFDWNVTSGDASSPAISSDKIVENVLSGAKNRKDAVVLFHDSGGREATVEALPEVIEGLIDMGFSFDVLSKDGYRVKFAR